MKIKYLLGVCATFVLFAAISAAQSPVEAFVKRAEKTTTAITADQLMAVAPESESAVLTAVTKDGRTVVLSGDGTWKYADQTPVGEEPQVSRNDFVRSTILIVTTDQSTYVEKPILVSAVIEASSYYNYGYRDADKTHFAFRLIEKDGKDAYVYMKRGELSSQLRARILAAGGKLKGVFVFKILKERQPPEPALTIHAELIGFKY